jgi:nicotinamidase-related amidase
MKKLLIVVDYQNDFVNGALGFDGAEKLADVIKNKIEEYLNCNDDVIFTLDTHEDNYMETLEGHKLPVKHCIKDSDGWKIFESCNYLNKAIKVFEKPTFPSLDLANYLKEKTYDEVELCGLVSNICVISNAIMVKASLPNAKIFIDAKATDSFDKVLQEKCFDRMKEIFKNVAFKDNTIVYNKNKILL